MTKMITRRTNNMKTNNKHNCNEAVNTIDIETMTATCNTCGNKGERND